MVLLFSAYPLVANSTAMGSADLHAGIAIAGALLGLATGLALLISRRALNSRFCLYAGLAFLVSGAVGLAQGLAVFRNPFGLLPSSLEQFTWATYLSGRVLSGGIFVLTPFLTRRLGDGKLSRNEAAWTAVAIAAVSVVVTALAFQVPLAGPGGSQVPVPRPLVLALSAVPLAALIAVLWEYHRARDVLTWWISLSIAIHLVGQVLMVFSRSLYDPLFEITHLYTALGSAVPLLGLALYKTRIILGHRGTKAVPAQDYVLLQALMDHLPDAIYFKDTASRFIRTNRAHATRWFGLSDPAQALGKTDFDFFSEEHARKAFEDEQEIVRTSQPLIDIEEKETWPDGRVTWVSTTKMPLYDEEGQIIGTFGVTKDITELKKLLRREQEQRQYLERLIVQIQETGRELSSSAAEIMAAATQQSTGASEQSAAISQVSSTVNQVCSIADQTSQRARQVADLAQRTVGVSVTGQQAVADAIAGMQAVRQRVETIATHILALSEQAQAVGQIISTVDEIAVESNMLALNAAVEAAHAGEAGKGFAVVAREVRSLAEQSRAATIQVREILTEIQRAVNTAVMATEEGMKGTDAGVQLTGGAGDAIRKLSDSVHESAQAATQIAAAAGQQLAGMEQIAQAMQGIHLVTTQNLAAVRQSEQAAERLNQMASQLRTTLEQPSVADA